LRIEDLDYIALDVFGAVFGYDMIEIAHSSFPLKVWIMGDGLRSVAETLDGSCKLT
jgi:hypothetical protein